MSQRYDVIVIGVGGFGSATMMHLASRHVSVLGLDQCAIGHDRGSSHGSSRIIRKAYFEHPDYVPLLHRSYELIRELSGRHRAELFEECGLIISGSAAGEAIAGARKAARLHQLPLQDLTATEARRRFPQFAFAEEHAVIFEAEAGYLHVEEVVRAHAAQARQLGAVFRRERVVDWSADSRGARVRTTDTEYEAGALVITAGAWAAAILADLGLPLRVLRKVQLWHPPLDNIWTDAPVFFFEQPQGCFYGNRPTGGPSSTVRSMIKVAEHSGGDRVESPDAVLRSLCPEDIAPVSAFIRRTLQHVDPRPAHHSVCMYTMTPDGHFIIDRHRAHPNVVIAAGFSGHGFKFTPVIGEVLADLAIQGETDQPIEFLRLDRSGLRS